MEKFYSNEDELIQDISRPTYLLNAQLLRRNLSLIDDVRSRSGAKILLAFKAFSLWSAFDLVKDKFPTATVSSPNEALLAFNHLGPNAHAYSPAYTDAEFDVFTRCCSHITFNSLNQYEHFRLKCKEADHHISMGLRINPMFSQVGTDLYNPCMPGSRLGVVADQLPRTLPEDIEGLHFHALCESDAEDLEKLLGAVEARFENWLCQVKWINMGGGHLMTRKGYNTEKLIALLKRFSEKWHLQVIIEPGSAFAWQTGPLVANVIDIVENSNIKTAIMDVSFACHMPDTLEMPYQPAIRGAMTSPQEGWFSYRMGGNSCLSGDFIADYFFPQELKIGDKIVLEDMIHYTTVKTTMFNGVSHPDIAVFNPEAPAGKQYRILRQYSYADYESRMG